MFSPPTAEVCGALQKVTFSKTIGNGTIHTKTYTTDPKKSSKGM